MLEVSDVSFTMIVYTCDRTGLLGQSTNLDILTNYMAAMSGMVKLHKTESGR